MTLRRDEKDGGWMVDCDKCGERHDLQGATLEGAMDEFRASEWQFIATSKGWKHECETCYATQEPAS